MAGSGTLSFGITPIRGPASVGDLWRSKGSVYVPEAPGLAATPSRCAVLIPLARPHAEVVRLFIANQTSSG